VKVSDVLEGRAEWTVVQGDALSLLRGLPAGVVHTCITSPPYFALRDYGNSKWEGGSDPACSLDGRKPERTARSQASSGLNGGTDVCHRSHVYGAVCARCGARRVSERWPAVTYSPMPGLPPVAVPEQEACLGLEATPEAFIGHLVLIFREVFRVLRDDGTCFVNLGDGYANNGACGGGSPLDNRTDGKSNKRKPSREADREAQLRSNRRVPAGLKSKDLYGMPWRLAFALQADGWYLRSDIQWIKPSPMPSSVRDRPTTAHEPIFLLAKSGKYFYDLEAERVPSASSTLQRDRYTRITTGKDGAYAVRHDHETPSDPAGRNLWTWWRVEEEGEPRYFRLKEGVDPAVLAQYFEPADLPGDCWEIGPEPLHAAHFAAYPSALPHRCIRLGTSERGVCSKCGAPHRREVERSRRELDSGRELTDGWNDGRHAPRGGTGCVSVVKSTGWRPSCSCAAGVVPALVLDPFAGACTTGVAARRLGRRFIGLELNERYCEIGRRRLRSAINEPERRRKATDQPTLFDQEEGRR
jgi:DNA modification methylase